MAKRRNQPVPRPTTQRVVVVGIDPSLANVGVCVLAVSIDGGVWMSHKNACIVIETKPEHGLLPRLVTIEHAVHHVVNKVLAQSPEVMQDADRTVYIAVEGFSFGDKFNQRDIAMGKSAALLGVARAVRALAATAPHIVEIPPREAKAAACPDWPGFSKANHTAAGLTTKWKQSNPGKQDVQTGLWRRFKINQFNEHEADAACVACAFLLRHFKYRGTDIGQEAATKATKARHL